MAKDIQTKIFEFFARRSRFVIRLFLVVYILILALVVVGSNLSLSDPKQTVFFYDIGKKAGQVGILLLGVIVLPGILGRFRIEIKLTRIITLFRRQLGITFFLLSFVHYHFVRGLALYSTKSSPFEGLLPFMIVGLSAFTIFFFMFLTSNNFSVGRLRKWWKYLHRMIYVALWLLVLHVGLQRISVWTIFIGTFAVLEVLSWVYYLLSKKDLNKTTGSAASGGDSGSGQS